MNSRVRTAYVSQQSNQSVKPGLSTAVPVQNKPIARKSQVRTSTTSQKPAITQKTRTSSQRPVSSSLVNPTTNSTAKKISSMVQKTTNRPQSSFGTKLKPSDVPASSKHKKSSSLNTTTVSQFGKEAEPSEVIRSKL